MNNENTDIIFIDLSTGKDADIESELLYEFRTKFIKKRNISLRLKLQRRRRYRKLKGWLKRYKKRWRRRPRTKRLMRMKKIVQKRFKGKAKRWKIYTKL